MIAKRSQASKTEVNAQIQKKSNVQFVNKLGSAKKTVGKIPDTTRRNNLAAHFVMMDNLLSDTNYFETVNNGKWTMEKILTRKADRASDRNFVSFQFESLPSTSCFSSYRTRAIT